jgi:hypothetical protein
MNVILICPENRPAAKVFQRVRPLALLPVLGRPLLDHAFEHLAGRGVREILVLASDRPSQIRSAIREGEVWGIKIDFLATTHELGEGEAGTLHATHFTNGERPVVLTLDQATGLPMDQLFRFSSGNHDFFSALLRDPARASQLTMRERETGVWISTRAKVDPDAIIEGPVWIGPRARVAAGAVIGPDTLIEAGAYIDRGARVSASWVGPETYTGADVCLEEAIAWGNGLTHWRRGAFTEVTDEFLLSHIRQKRARSGASLAGRGFALALWLGLLPAALIAMAVSRLRGKNVFTTRWVVLPHHSLTGTASDTAAIQSLNSAPGLLSRWPEFLEVLRGKMALTGNRPLSLEAAASLRGPAAHHWLHLYAGVFSLADAEGCDGDSLLDAAAYAAWFTARPTLKVRLSVIARCLGRFFAKPDSGRTLTNPPQLRHA